MAMVLKDKPKCTLINRFDGSFLLIGPGGKERLDSFMAFIEVETEVRKRGWTIGVTHSSLKEAEEEPGLCQDCGGPAKSVSGAKEFG